jgi:hypothetical protein
MSLTVVNESNRLFTPTMNIEHTIEREGGE